MAWEMSLGGARVMAEVEELGDGSYRVTLDGHPIEVDARFPEAGVMHLIRGHEAFDLDVRAVDAGQEVTLYGTRYTVDVIDERHKALRALGIGAGAGDGDQAVSTSMPGRVVALLVEEGQAVEAGQPVIVVEAMKMENELKAAAPGVVKEILVAVGDAVEGGRPLIVVAPMDEA